ncbi:MAG: hypothetical protein WD768_13150 [Phycisphaeraceae bacterium]
MTVTVQLETINGQFRASIVGSERYQAVAPSRDQALSALRTQVMAKVAEGELIDMELPISGVSGLAGIFRDDPTLEDIVRDIYAKRDADRP